MTITLHHADALDVLRALPDNSVDAVVTDPPYGLAELRTEHVTAAIAAWVTGDRERVPDGAWTGAHTDAVRARLVELGERVA